MKRNTESKCRQKIINEWNLNKKQQKELDMICKNHGCRYKLIYRMMPSYNNNIKNNNRKKLYIKKLFEGYPKNDVVYSDFNNWFICRKAAILATSYFLDKEDD